MDRDTTQKVIQYWDKASLCSRESSTSHADPDLVYLDNLVELFVLRQCLDAWRLPRGRVLDVGAGFGRFTPLFLQFATQVVLLEAADSIYQNMADIWKSHEDIKCHHGEFDAYVDDDLFSLVFASGILYFYDDNTLNAFLTKATAMLSVGGLLIVRDFVSVPREYEKKSSYVEGATCYYRTPDYWKRLAAEHGLEFLKITRSKPQWNWLRNGRTLRILELLRLKHCLRGQIPASIMKKLGSFRLGASGVQTVFIGMRKMS